MPVDKSLLEAIQAKDEAERTDVEKALLELSAAGQDDKSNTDDGVDWTKAFEHPRFKELVNKRKEAEDKLQAIEADRKKKEIETLAANNEFKALYENTQKELEDYKKKAATADSYEEVLKKTLEAEFETLRPEAKKLVPASLSVADRLEYIAINRQLLQKQQANDIGGGRRNLSNSNSKGKELSAEERATAKLFGMAEEDYAKFSGSPEVQSQSNTWHDTFSQNNDNNQNDKGDIK